MPWSLRLWMWAKGKSLDWEGRHVMIRIYTLQCFLNSLENLVRESQVKKHRALVATLSWFSLLAVSLHDRLTLKFSATNTGFPFINSQSLPDVIEWQAFVVFWLWLLSYMQIVLKSFQVLTIKFSSSSLIIDLKIRTLSFSHTLPYCPFLLLVH